MLLWRPLDADPNTRHGWPPCWQPVKEIIRRLEYSFADPGPTLSSFLCSPPPSGIPKTCGDCITTCTTMSTTPSRRTCPCGPCTSARCCGRAGSCSRRCARQQRRKTRSWRAAPSGQRSTLCRKRSLRWVQRKRRSFTLGRRAVLTCITLQSMQAVIV